MGKLGFIAVFFAFGISLFSAEFSPPHSTLPLSEEIRAVYFDLLRIGIELPFSKIYSADEDMVRQEFDNAISLLETATREVVTEPERGRPYLSNARLGIQRVGLLLPFHAIVSQEERNQLIDRYLSSEDKLAEILGKLDGVPAPPPSQTVWFHNGLVWKPLAQPLSLAGAEAACSAIVAPGTTEWRVPTFDELRGSFRAMKKTEINPVFGSRAGAWTGVWTSTPYDPTRYPDYFVYLDFIKEQKSAATRDKAHHVVCVGKEVPTGRSPR